MIAEALAAAGQEALAAAGQIAGAALGGPAPSSSATGGTSTIGPNNVSYNKGPSYQMLAGLAAVALVVWLWKRKRN